MQVGADFSPWSPTFDTIGVMQEVRDAVYPNSEHVLDKDSAVYHIVSRCSLLTTILISRLFFHTGPAACV
jgi:hypothetical protein